ncbi:hypothetical protein AB0A60_35610 [Streptomyces sp. NPDC046275]|uniref:hypothetical protein n=1 Tax=Streptomyces sp. NPDC046275 TaxID=3157201 RepID=UPI0033F0D8DD
MKFTYICEWTDKKVSLYDTRFAIVVNAESEKEAAEKGARAALTHYPAVADYESHRTFWHGEFGATRIAEFRGDVTGNLIDRAAFDIIHA